MPTITFQGQQYECAADEPLLEALNRQGTKLPYGCRAGSCQACMLKATRGTPPAAAQIGIEQKLKDRNYFLSCLCRADTDMEVALPDPADRYHASIVFEKEFLNASVIRLRSSRPEGFVYQPGQFVNLLKPDLGLARSYSLASSCSDNFLEFHIRLIPDGRMSGWIADTVENGAFIFVSDAMGNCCYRKDYNDYPLLLAGTGTGLAPLYGILRDALGSGHRQHIQLLHGGLNSEGLYYQQQLRQLEQQHDCFDYKPCVLNGEAPAGGVQGAIDAQLQQSLKSGQNWRVFLCGDSDIVNTMRKVCLAHDIDQSEIHTDAFG
ncbi:MAG: hypothetical protein AUJ57_12025 [Zetaproteobacteria bacterium CG1_02_53_45]|nr:MAG: hypothetical protein AUJ57_12025 [Zetaproteobacteria bacterium CG1_02_53_45]